MEKTLSVRKMRLAAMPPMPVIPGSVPVYYKPKPKKDYPNLTAKQIMQRAAHIAYVVERRKKRDKSMPQWADREKIKEFYIKAKELSVTTGIKYEVDHIIPSKHPLVCGLHNEFNLQVITETENLAKSNKFDI